MKSLIFFAQIIIMLTRKIPVSKNRIQMHMELLFCVGLAAKKLKSKTNLNEEI